MACLTFQWRSAAGALRPLVAWTLQGGALQDNNPAGPRIPTDPEGVEHLPRPKRIGAKRMWRRS